MLFHFPRKRLSLVRCKRKKYKSTELSVFIEVIVIGSYIKALFFFFCSFRNDLQIYTQSTLLPINYVKDDRPYELDITEQSFSFTTTQPAVLPKSKEKKTFCNHNKHFHTCWRENETLRLSAGNSNKWKRLNIILLNHITHSRETFLIIFLLPIYRNNFSQRSDKSEKSRKRTRKKGEEWRENKHFKYGRPLIRLGLGHLSIVDSSENKGERRFLFRAKLLLVYCFRPPPAGKPCAL